MAETHKSTLTADTMIAADFQVGKYTLTHGIHLEPEVDHKIPPQVIFILVFLQIRIRSQSHSLKSKRPRTSCASHLDTLCHSFVSTRRHDLHDQQTRASCASAAHSGALHRIIVFRRSTRSATGSGAPYHRKPDDVPGR